MFPRLLTALASLAAVAACRAPVEPARAPRILTSDVYVEAALEDVWRHLVEPEAIGAWFSSRCLAFGPDVGGPATFGTEERVTHVGTVLALDEPERVAYSFDFQGFGFDEPATRVEIELAERGPTVLVRVRHDCTGAPETHALIGPLGWTKATSRLKTLLETGSAMSWPVEPES